MIVPAVGEVKVTPHAPPDVPTVPHWSPGGIRIGIAPGSPGSGVSVTWTIVPSGAGSQTGMPGTWLPWSTNTFTTNVCACPTLFVASGGLIVMYASTKRFVAGPLPPGPLLPDVERVTSAVAGLALGSLSTKCQTAVAFAVNVPAWVLLIVTVQVAVVPLTCGVLQSELSVLGCGET